MAQPIELLQGTVKYPVLRDSNGNPTPKDYGGRLRINVVVNLSDGTEAKLWGNPDDLTLISLKKGQQIQVCRDNKGVRLVGQPSPPPASSPFPQLPNLPAQNNSGIPPMLESQEGREQIKTYIKWQAKLVRQCYEEAITQFCENKSLLDLTDVNDREVIKSIALTLYISAQKKYNL